MKKWLWVEIIVLAVVLTVAAGLLLTDLLTPEIQVQPAAAATVRTETVVPLEQKLGATWKVYSEKRKMAAHSAFVYDCQADEILVQTGDLNAKIYPASITKLFTCYCLLEILKPDQQVTAGDALSLVPWDSSVAGIRNGDVLSVEKLIQAMLLPSGNDASCILAAEAGRTLAGDKSLPAASAVQVFMERVNRRLKEENLTGTHFVTPDGYHDPDHYTTMADMITIAKLALSNETIAKNAAVVKLATGLKQIPQWSNTNALLHPESEYYCPFADGLKTGSTTEAGNCLVSSFTVRDNRYIVGVFGCAERGDRFADTLDLLNEVLGVTK